MKRTFPSKILLFGEYSIIRGSRALCLSYPLFKGQLDFNRDGQSRPDRELQFFSTYLKFLKESDKLPVPIDIQSLDFDISQGLYFNSTIPRGFGIGSSGALTAAIFDYYKEDGFKNNDITFLKEVFAALESHFHGSSSGVDPLVSYLGKSLLVNGTRELSIVNIPRFKPNNGAIFLLNTGRPRSTEHLVNLFLEKSQSPEFEKKYNQRLLPVTHSCISCFLQSHTEELVENFRELSRLQFEYFSFMIPPLFKELWRKGFEQNNYYLKLCGAGGGGFFLGLTKDMKALNKSLRNCEIRPVIYL